MHIFLDLVVVVVIAVFAFFGSKRGAIRAAVSLALTIAAALIAFAVSKPVANSIYDGHIKNQIISQMQSGFESIDLTSVVKDGIKDNLGVEISDADVERIAKSDDILTEIQDIAADHGEIISAEEIDEKFEKLLSQDSIEEMVGDNVPDNVVESITTTLRESRDDIETVIRAVCGNDGSAAAKKIEEKLVRGPATFIIRGIAALLIFIAAGLAFRLLYTVLSKLKIIPACQKVSALAGLVIGIAEGMLIMFIVGMCINYVTDHSYGIMTFLGQDIIEKTVLFKYFL